MRISDWSSDVCSSDLRNQWLHACGYNPIWDAGAVHKARSAFRRRVPPIVRVARPRRTLQTIGTVRLPSILADRSEEHTSELQSLMRTCYAVFGSKTKQTHHKLYTKTTNTPDS